METVGGDGERSHGGSETRDGKLRHLNIFFIF